MSYPSHSKEKLSPFRIFTAGCSTTSTVLTPATNYKLCISVSFRQREKRWCSFSETPQQNDAENS